ncbi:MAG: hypothetical protein RSD57_13600 [Comamonas sp.]
MAIRPSGKRNPTGQRESIGAKASDIIGRSGYSITTLYDLHQRSTNGEQAAAEQIAKLIKSNADLDLVFYAFRSATKRVQDAQRRVQGLKSKRPEADPRNGGWAKLSAQTTAKRPVRK